MHPHRHHDIARPASLVAALLLTGMLAACGGGGGGSGGATGTRVLSAETAADGDQLWITDGTRGGTEQLEVINSAGDASPQFIFHTDDLAFFGATNGSDGIEPWVSDGTASGTRMLADINTSGDSIPVLFMEYRGMVYFVADDGSGEDLWRTDGTPAGTTQVTTDTDLTRVGDMAVVGFTLFFVGTTGTEGTELWKTDGTIGGESLVEDIIAGTGSGVNTITGGQDLTAFDGRLFFVADGGGGDVEIWRSGGLPGNTEKVTSIRPGGDAAPNDLTVYDGELFFRAKDSTNNDELWKTDGSVGGESLVHEFDPSSFGFVNDITVFDGALFMVADDGNGNELFKSLGTSVSTAKVADINGSSGDSLPVFPRLTVVGDRLYFEADDGSGAELWQTNGSIGHARRIKDVNPGGGSNPRPLGALDGDLLFRANDGSNGLELWISEDGTPDTTSLVKDINPGSASSNPFF